MLCKVYMICQKNNSKRLAKNKLQGIAKNKLQKYQVKIFFQKISEKISLQYWQKISCKELQKISSKLVSL